MWMESGWKLDLGRGLMSLVGFVFVFGLREISKAILFKRQILT
jgi:hypothetical protein